MLIYTVREGMELEVLSSRGTFFIRVIKKDGKIKLGMSMADEKLHVRRINDGKTVREIKEDREKRIVAGKIKRREMENQIKELRFGITQAGLDYLAVASKPKV